MKVLFVQKIIGIAGSENYLIQIITGLKARNVEVEFVSLVPKRLRGKEQHFNTMLGGVGINVHTIFYSFPMVHSLYQLSSIIKKNKYDLIHSHLIHADFFLALVRTFFYSNFKFVSAKHGYEESYTSRYGFDPLSRKKNLYWRLLRWSEKKIDRSYAISKGLQRLFIGLEICKEEQLDFIHYGFDFNEISGSNEFRFSNNQLVLVGRLTAFKGHKFALHAIAQLKDNIPDILLVIVGSGTMEVELKKMAKELKLENNVKFLGYHPNGRQVMADSDIVLIPSIAEGFGVVVLEAFSVYKPIIAFDVPSLDEHIVSGLNGILITPYDISRYSEAIENLLYNKVMAKNLAVEANKRLIGYYSLDRMTDQTIEFYNKVISQK